MCLDLGLTSGMAIGKGRGNVCCKVLSLAHAKDVIALGRK